MKEAFEDKLRLNKKNKAQLEIINSIIEEYLSQGYRLTLRQLYYQLVSRGIISNSTKEYAKISKIVVKGRMAGIIDWDAIEDRIRRPRLPYYVFGIEDAINDTINTYRLDRMDNQGVYIEVWVEKDALSGVLSRITSKYHIRLMVNRGYSSCTAMYDAAKRFKYKVGKRKFIFYLGDHDPSGLDMVRDIEDRIGKFQAYPRVLRLALTQEQIQQYNPPPNPAKIKDPRAKEYIQEFGNTSWEVDALKPEVLNQILIDKIEETIDMELFKAKLELEELHRIKLRSIIEKEEEE